jgi:RHS repeat-associated protein
MPSEKSHNRRCDQWASLQLHLLEEADKGHLEDLQCPNCAHASVGVWFTHPAADTYRTWFICSDCDFHTRVQNTERPRFFSEDRVSTDLEERDLSIVRQAIFQAAAAALDVEAYTTMQASYCYDGASQHVSQCSVARTYKVTGKERDADSNLDMFGARYYGSSLGKFMTPDWAEKPTNVRYASFGNPQSLNLYSYVNNNPTTARDPDGHCDWCLSVVTRVAEYVATHPEVANAVQKIFVISATARRALAMAACTVPLFPVISVASPAKNSVPLTGRPRISGASTLPAFT